MSTENVDTPYVKIGCVANLFSRQMHFKKAGDVEHGHTHPFNHLTLLASGSLRVTVNGETTDFKAPHMIYIYANAVHQLTALEDNTVAFCIHPLRKGDDAGDILDPESVPKGVHPLAYADPVVCGMPDYDEKMQQYVETTKDGMQTPKSITVTVTGVESNIKYFKF